MLVVLVDIPDIMGVALCERWDNKHGMYCCYEEK